MQIWRITPTRNIPLDMEASSLDEVTRRLPDGYYSTFRTFGECGRVLGLTEHLRRLYDPVSTAEVGEPFLRRQLSVLLEPYRPGEARVRAMMTKEGQVYLAIEPLKPWPREIYEKGVRVETTELQREQPRLKSTAFIGRSETERVHIAREGIFEALLVKDGKILEGMTSNFFYVGQVDRERRAKQRQSPKRDNLPYLSTAREDVLLGITRDTVIELARNEGVEVEYQPLRLDEIETVQEAFITSSSRGIVPVIKIDEVSIGQGSPGPITQRLIAAYEPYVMVASEQI
jgi:branched-chain amino acid aminotransferase